MNFMPIKVFCLTVLLSVLATISHAQIDPTRDVNWPKATGAGTPTSLSISCTSANYGQPYTDTTNNNEYFCTTSGWVQISGGGGGGLNGVSNKSTSYTATSGDNGKNISLTCPGTCGLTLPTSVPANGWTVFVTCEGVAACTITPTSGASLLNAGGVAIGVGTITPGMGVSVWSDGTNYHVNSGGIVTASTPTPVLVQSTIYGPPGSVDGCPSGCNSITLAAGSGSTENVSSGSALIVEFFHSNGGTVNIPTDVQGDVFTETNYQLLTAEFNVIQYVACGVAGGATTISMAGANAWNMIAAYEVVGAAAASCVDAYSSAQASRGPLGTGSITTTKPNDFIFVTGASRGSPPTLTEANGYSVVIASGAVGALTYTSWYGIQPGTGTLSDTVSECCGDTNPLYAGILALKPTTASAAFVEGDLVAAQPNLQLGALHQGAAGTAFVSNGPGAMPSSQTVLTTNPLSGMTGGQVPIAATAGTVTSSKALAGAGAAIVTGPASSVSGDVTEYTGTGGQTADSGILLSALAPNASPAFTGTPDASGATQFKLPVGAAYASAANGECGYDSTNLNWHCWVNGADTIMLPLASGFTSGHCPEPTLSGATWYLVDSGGACGTSGGGSAFSAITTGTNTAALTMGTGGKLTYSGTGIVNANQVNGFAPQPFVAANAYGANSSSVTSVTSSSMSVAVGDLVHVLCRTGGSSVNVTDSLSNSWSSATCQTGGASQICASYSTITTGGSGTFTCNWTTANTYDSIIALDVKNTLGTLNAHVGATGSSAINFVQAYSLSSSQRTADIYCYTVGSNSVYFAYSNLDGTVLSPYTSYVSGQNYPDSGCIFHNATTSETTVPTDVVISGSSATWTGLLMGYNY